MARGGARNGAGRKVGTPNRLAGEVRTLALEFGPDALQELATLAGVTKDEDGKPIAGAASDTARISAIGMLIERAYGRPTAGRPVRIDLPDTSTVDGVTKAVSILVRAAAAADITPGEASELCGVLDSQRRAIELSEIATRLAKLEALQNGSNLPGQHASEHA